MTAQNFLTATQAEGMALFEYSVNAKNQVQKEELGIAIASQNHLEEEYNQAQDEVYTWVEVAFLAQKEGRDDLLLEALRQKQFHQKKANSLKVQLDDIRCKINELRLEVA
jgi:phage shock protein A